MNRPNARRAIGWIGLLGGRGRADLRRDRRARRVVRAGNRPPARPGDALRATARRGPACLWRGRPAGRRRRLFRGVRPVRLLPPADGRRGGQRRVDRPPVARLDDGQRRPRSLLAGLGAGRGGSLSGPASRHRADVRDLPHAPGGRDGQRGWGRRWRSSTTASSTRKTTCTPSPWTACPARRATRSSRTGWAIRPASAGATPSISPCRWTSA